MMERLTDDDVRHVIEMLERADRWAFQDQTLSLLKELLALRARNGEAGGGTWGLSRCPFLLQRRRCAPDGSDDKDSWAVTYGDLSQAVSVRADGEIDPAPPSRTRPNEGHQNGRINEAEIPETWAEAEELITKAMSYHERRGYNLAIHAVCTRIRLWASVRSVDDARSNHRVGVFDTADLP